MASPSCAGLLPIPCCSGQLGSVAHLCPARLSVVAERSGPPQPTRSGAMGSSHPFVEPLDSTPPRSAPLPHGPLCRSASLVRAVCVKALVRICAGAISDGRPYRDSCPGGDRRLAFGLCGHYSSLTAESYKRGCQEKYLSFGSVPEIFWSRHPAPLLERALSTTSGLAQADGRPSPGEAARLSSIPVIPFLGRDGALRFLKLASVTVAALPTMVLSETRGL